MITLYTWGTPNGRKPIIMLEELGLSYQVRPVDISEGQQHSPDFLEISPNNKIPAMIDDEAEGGRLPLFESGAILTYLAERHGTLLAPSGAARYRALQWLFWQIGGLGPMAGQLGFFAKKGDALPLQHFTAEVQRLFGVMERGLAKAPYLAGAEYSIADIASYPWTRGVIEHLPALADTLAADKPALGHWLERVGSRPAVQRGMAWKPG
jgi:GSH-dependent disulfide-bond oxidoreductase